MEITYFNWMCRPMPVATCRVQEVKKHNDPECKACLVNYNLISKIETASQDTDFIQKLLKVESIGKFPNAYENTEMDYVNYENNLKLLYQNISENVMDDVCRIWKWDFLLFDYDITKFCKKEFWE